jgi:hypothetical protein
MPATLISSLVAIGASLLLTVSVAAAPADTTYVAHLRRAAQDTYRDQSTGLVVITNGCLSLTPGDDVLYNDALRQLTFPDGETCYVRGIYRPSIQLTRVDQDLYRDLGGRGYPRTRFCYVYTYGEDVVVLEDTVIFLG